MATEQPDEWRTQMELDIAAIAQAMQLLAQRVDPGPHSSVSNPSNPASERSNPSPLHESHCEPCLSVRLIKRASPNDFSGERTKGRAFLNSCELYLHLVPHQFEDDAQPGNPNKTYQNWSCMV